MVCLSGADCQQEISPVLRSCRPMEGACAAAHEELRAQWGTLDLSQQPGGVRGAAVGIEPGVGVPVRARRGVVVAS